MIVDAEHKHRPDKRITDHLETKNEVPSIGEQLTDKNENQC